MMRIWILMPMAWLALCAAAPTNELAPDRYIDPRIRTVLYSADEIVPIAISPGYQLTVELGRGEHIESVAIGDNDGWVVTPNKRGDYLFIKPIESAATTNLTVITDARIYLFELAAGGDMGLPYILRFRYGENQAATGEPVIERTAGDFRLRGSRSIRPARMFDDGEKTYIILKPDQALPAIFAIDADGKEMLVNGAMRDGQYVVDSLANRFVLRLDRQAVFATRKPGLEK